MPALQKYSHCSPSLPPPRCWCKQLLIPRFIAFQGFMAEQVKMPEAAWKEAHVDSTCESQEAVKAQEWGHRWAIQSSDTEDLHGSRAGLTFSLHACPQLYLEVPDLKLIFFFPERNIPRSGLRGYHPCIRCWRKERSS